MKIAFITCMWKRPRIFELFAKGIINLQKAFPDVEIQCFVAGSEGEVSKSLAEKFGFVYTEFPNEHLNKKFNAAALSCKEWGPDWVILMGSDNIMSPLLLRTYLCIMHDPKPHDFIILQDCFFYDVTTKNACKWAGHTFETDFKLAVGRGFSSKILNALGWEICFTRGGHRTIEQDINIQLQPYDGERAGVISGGYFYDLKSGENMHEFRYWNGSEKACATTILTAGLGEEFANEILSVNE